jgi:hypothetical protein
MHFYSVMLDVFFTCHLLHPQACNSVNSEQTICNSVNSEQTTVNNLRAVQWRGG